MTLSDSKRKREQTLAIDRERRVQKIKDDFARKQWRLRKVMTRKEKDQPPLGLGKLIFQMHHFYINPEYVNQRSLQGLRSGGYPVLDLFICSPKIQIWRWFCLKKTKDLWPFFKNLIFDSFL